MKNATACKQCRQAKRRCVVDANDSVCTCCRLRGLDCTLASQATRARCETRSIQASTQSESTRDSVLLELTEEQKLALTDDYFVLIHDRPHSLFHRPTFMKDLNSGRVEEALILSICAMASYLSVDDSVRQLGPRMAQASKHLLLSNIAVPSLARVQTAILLANIYAAELDPHAEAMFFAVANRMAQILRLHTVADEDEPILQQIKNRVWWTLVMADYWSSAGLMVPRQLYQPPTDLPFPGMEDVFQRAAPDQQLLDMSKPGLWAHMITLVQVFGLIQDLHQQLVKEVLSYPDLHRTVENLAHQLDNWAAMLPADVVLNQQNLHDHVHRGLGGPFVALHLGFHHYCTLLFFHTLDSHRPQTRNAADFSGRCRAHALAFSRLLRTSRSSHGCEAIYATVGQMIVVSSSVLLHALLFGEDTELAEARDSLLENFAALVDLKKLWPSLGITIRRLFTFQNACQPSEHDDTHRIDQWMFRFLYQHSTLLGDRPPSGSSPHSTASQPGALLQPGVTRDRELAYFSALDTLKD